MLIQTPNSHISKPCLRLVIPETPALLRVVRSLPSTFHQRQQSSSYFCAGAASLARWKRTKARIDSISASVSLPLKEGMPNST